MTAVWIAIISVIIGLSVHGAVVAYGYGKQTQKTAELKSGQEILFARSEQHQLADNIHFKDTNLHWDSRERDWMNKRFENIEKMLAELLRRNPDPEGDHEYRKGPR